MCVDTLLKIALADKLYTLTFAPRLYEKFLCEDVDKRKKQIFIYRKRYYIAR